MIVRGGKCEWKKGEGNIKGCRVEMRHGRSGSLEECV